METVKLGDDPGAKTSIVAVNSDKIRGRYIVLHLPDKGRKQVNWDKQTDRFSLPSARHQV